MEDAVSTDSLIKKVEQQFCKDVESLTLLLATVGEIREQQNVSHIVSKHLNFPLRSTIKKRIVCGSNVRAFDVYGEFILIYLPLDSDSSRMRKSVNVWLTSTDKSTTFCSKASATPVASAVSAHNRLNTPFASVWAVCKVHRPISGIENITIAQNFVNHPQSLQTIELKRLPFEKIMKPFSENISQAHVEVLIEMHLLNDARAAVDTRKYSLVSLKTILNSFIDNGNFKIYRFNGWSCLFGVDDGIFTDSMIFLPDPSSKATWSIYSGEQIMPSRIYITSKDEDRLDELLKHLDWPSGIVLEIRF